VVVAKRLDQPFTRRDAKAEPGQDLAKPVDANPDVMSSRYSLTVPQAYFVQLVEERFAALLRCKSVMRQEVAAKKIALIEHVGQR
jgi:hypothetical protein